MATILILYSTTDGHTRDICLRLQQVVEGLGHRVTLASLADAPAPDPQAFDKIVIGARIRYGRHSPRVLDFVRRHLKALETRPSAFFSVNAVARKAGKERPETNPYVRKFLRRTPWRPAQLAVFGGKIDYARYRLLDRAVIRLIMRLTGGPTDLRVAVDFTDWQQVEAFGMAIVEM